MKIILLSAGKGERLMPLTRNTPKPLLQMSDGNTLLEEQIKSITHSGVIDEIIIVIGYCAHQIEAKILHHVESGVKIRTVFNPFYNRSNNLISLWLAKPEMDGDFLISNGDNIFSSKVFQDFTSECGDGIHLSISKKTDYDPDDMKVTINEDKATRVSKLIEGDKINAESPGLVLVRGPMAISYFKDSLEKIVRDPRSLDSFWLEAFNYMSDNGLPPSTWEFNGNDHWQEVDFHLDLEKAREFLQLKRRV